MTYISKYIIFPPGKADQGVPNKDPTVWLDGARPANTCIPPSFPGNLPMQPHNNIPTPNAQLQVYKN